MKDIILFICQVACTIFFWLNLMKVSSRVGDDVQTSVIEERRGVKRQEKGRNQTDFLREKELKN